MFCFDDQSGSLSVLIQLVSLVSKFSVSEFCMMPRNQHLMVLGSIIKKPLRYLFHVLECLDSVLPLLMQLPAEAFTGWQ